MKKKHGVLFEYVLVTLIVSIFVISIVYLLRNPLKDGITRLGCAASSTNYVKGEEPGQSYCLKPKEE